MYILKHIDKLNEYEGIYTNTICVSESLSKLNKVSNNILKEAKHYTKERDDLIKLEREKSIDRTRFIKEIDQIKNKCKYLLEFDMFNNDLNLDFKQNVVFLKIEEIKEI